MEGAVEVVGRVHGDAAGERAGEILGIEGLELVQGGAGDVPQQLAIGPDHRLRPRIVRIVRLRPDHPADGPDID